MPSAHQDAEISFPIVDDVKSLFRFGLQYGCGTTVIEITRRIRTGDNTIVTSTTSSALAVKVNAWFCASMVSFGEAMREVLVKGDRDPCSPCPHPRRMMDMGSM
jgi:hypothetical protein